MENYSNVILEAEKKALESFQNCTPTPVSWVQSDLMNNPIGEPSELDYEGECGGAYISGLDGRSPFVNWCKKNLPENIGSIQKGVYKGYTIYLKIKNYNGQSVEKKESYAQAFKKVLNENGVKCCVKTYLT